MSIFRSRGSRRVSALRQSVSMMLGVFLLLQHLLLIAPSVTRATPVFVSTDIVISEFRVRGPNGGSDEFIELYNLTNSPVNIGGWKINGSNSAGGTGTRVTINAGTMIPARGHFLATNSSTSGGPYSGSVTGDQTYTTGITDDGGIALLTPSNVIVDAVGMSTGSAYKEGTVLTNLGSSNLNRCYERKPGGASGSTQDTDNNSADFQLISPCDPQNLASPPTPSGSTNPTGVGAANPNSLPAGASTLLTVTVTPGTGPTSTGLAVSANLSSIGGSATQSFFDNGTNGDVTAGDNIFSYLATVGVLTTGGAKSLPFTVSDAQVRSSNANISLFVEPPVLKIHTIQGSGNTSPYAGTFATTTGIVTGRKSNGFFIQEPDATVDADPNTSEGIFVFTSSAPTVAVGDSVKVTGSVVEFASSSDPSSPTITEFTGSPTVMVLSSGNPLPAPILITAADANVNDINNLEKYEFMRVRVDSLTVVAPTEGFVNEVNASSTTNGIFYGVITGTPRPFREPGIQVPNPVPAPMPPNVPRFDANPELIRVDGDGQPGVAAIDVTTGAIVTNITGPLDYGARSYTILPDTTPSFSGNISATPVSSMGEKEFTVSTLTM